ncbi:fructosamine kinase [Aequorivita sp. H23M31]|uniref:Fructosamine kinase n=1 Tax=Aequorivita ciconiae TaxID=2494375 RepID=A0A410G6Z5_9FLAO|nr:fructosamine kinase family protein [Aequorivita sp. H23M31]QAA82991.1 fructosamine kinase [Aequorivita sp. H23M31]
MEKLHFKITAENNLNLLQTKTLSGGDINTVFLLKCEEGNFVIKLNDASRFPRMFEAEAKGLNLLRDSDSFRIPEIISNGAIEGTSYLLMEFLQDGNKTKNFWSQFASHLAKLHKNSQSYFGLDHDNYIGSLHQTNLKCISASEFFISQRLQPQFRMASENGFNFKDLEKFYKNISEEIPKEPSSLIHGDLWGGNYMVSEEGRPTLIDPAVAFAPREMDLAMMKLFGGFDNVVFTTYNEIFPLTDGWTDRHALWQLYYLLVHLNLFGSGYLNRVKSIVSNYS